MAKKADLLVKAKELGVNVTEKNTIAEIEAAIAEVNAQPEAKQEKVEKATLAKSGKRSAKAIAEVEAKQEKEARKEAGDTTPQSEE